jgi:hypothetical protein
MINATNDKAKKTYLEQKTNFLSIRAILSINMYTFAPE